MKDNPSITSKTLLRRTLPFYLILLFTFATDLFGAGTVSVTPAPNGTSIPSIRAANGSSPSFTSIGDIVLFEDTAGGGLNKDGFVAATNQTLILTAPTNWQFEITTDPSYVAGSIQVTFAAGGDITAASIAVARTTITVTFTANGSPNDFDILTIKGIRVQAVNSALIPSTGQIYRKTGAGGNASIPGVTATANADGSAGTNFGTLSQVGAASQLAFTTSSQTITAGQVSGVITLESRDAGGTAVNVTSNTTITLSSNSTGTATFSSSPTGTPTTNTITLLSGTSTISFYYSDTKSGTSTITASSSLTSPTQAETISPAAASKLVFTTSAVTTTAGVASGTITVQRQDSFGNPNTADANRTVTLSSNSTGTVTFTPASPLTITTGSSSVSFTYTDTKSGGPTITAASTAPTTITSATQIETINPAALDHFKVESAALGNIPDQIVGTAFNIKITAQDFFNNTQTSFVGTVTMSTSAGAISAGSVTTTNFTLGVLASHAVTYTAAATGGTILTATSGAITGDSNSFIVNPNTPTLLSATPDSAIQTETGRTIVLAGTDIAAGATAAFSNGGITITNTVVNVLLQTVTVTIDVAPAAVPGLGTVAIKNATSGFSNTVDFTVIASAISIQWDPAASDGTATPIGGTNNSAFWNISGASAVLGSIHRTDPAIISGETQHALNLLVKNIGNISVKLTASYTNSPAWTAMGSAGHNQYVLGINNDGSSTYSNYLTAGTPTYEIVNPLAVTNSQNFDLKIQLPTTTSNVSQTISVRVTATAP